MVCPTCNRCPTCGSYQAYPSYPYWGSLPNCSTYQPPVYKYNGPVVMSQTTENPFNDYESYACNNSFNQAQAGYTYQQVNSQA